MKLRILPAGLLFLFLLWTLPARAETANIAVAANFTAAAQEIETAFEAATGHDVVLSFGSTGKLYAQITHGAPFDAFLAADAARPQRLEDEGQGVAGTRFNYALGQLVLWTPTDGADPKALLEAGDYGKLAIANPKTAPYGAAAMQVLERMDLLPEAGTKIVQGDSIAQTRQFVFSGAADLGFVALAQVVLDTSGSRWPVPEELYDPIVQQALLLDRGAENPAARDFLTFLRDPQALAIIHRYGYGLDE